MGGMDPQVCHFLHSCHFSTHDPYRTCSVSCLAAVEDLVAGSSAVALQGKVQEEQKILFTAYMLPLKTSIKGRLQSLPLHEM
jgi:hypothetical protein